MNSEDDPTVDYVKAVVIRAVSMLPDEERSEWREFHGISDDDPLSLLWETLPMWTPKQREVISVALRDWCASQVDVSSTLRCFARSSRRIGSRLACAVARASLKHDIFASADGLHSQRAAVDAAERWVRGDASVEECRSRYDVPEGITTISPCYIALTMVYEDKYDEIATKAGRLAATLENIVPMAGVLQGFQEATKPFEDGYKRSSRKLCEVAASAVATALEDAAIGYEKEQQRNAQMVFGARNYSST